MATIQPVSDTIQTQNTVLSSQTASSDFSEYMDVPTSLYDIFQKASETYNISADLLMAVGKAESNYNPDATSSCGAQGVMQLMPSTASGLGVTDAYDAEQNIMAGAKYLSGLMDKYNGNYTLACAAYNAGSGNVSKYGGVPPFKETQNYVAKIANYLNEGVSAPTTALTSTNSSRTTGALNSVSLISDEGSDTSLALDELFSYDDYLQFLDIYLNQVLDTSSSDEQENNESTPDYLAFQNIQYNNSIMNLLKNSTSI